MNDDNHPNHLLVILGEVRGDVKGILREQSSMSQRLVDLEKRLERRMAGIEESADERLTVVEKRLGSLEALRMQLAGVILAATVILSLVKDRIAAAASAMIGV